MPQCPIAGDATAGDMFPSTPLSPPIFPCHSSLPVQYFSHLPSSADKELPVNPCLMKSAVEQCKYVRFTFQLRNFVSPAKF